jgi:hypothetical protein
MTSDRARVTYDPSRHYTGVVAQQGRVSLEADWNEAQAIDGEQIEARTLDLIGPVASADDGYRVEAVLGDDGATGDLRVRCGTLYLGGQRLSAPHDLLCSGQQDSDWVDCAGDPLWREDRDDAQPHELVYLLAREQEVGATEDHALRDVALGGPDTAQRLRILQRIIRRPTNAATWEDAWGQVIQQHWNHHGFRLDRDTRRLEPAARLQVMGHPAESGEQPVDQGSYLGPNNQLIRIQITRTDDDGVPVLVWGYDNASFLYRLISSVVSTASHDTTLTLATSPVDAYHQPAEHQAVEVLRSAASLANHDHAAETVADEDGRRDFIAAATGQVVKVTTAYSPGTRVVTVGTELPEGYRLNAGDEPPLFLRVWQREFRCEPGEEHELEGTGIRIRLTAPDDDHHDHDHNGDHHDHDHNGDHHNGEHHDHDHNGEHHEHRDHDRHDDDHPDSFPMGAYWMIAVRPGVGPGSPGLVYPQRILDRPQPPDGPREWLAPIAFVRWHPRTPATEDLVPRFDSLVRQERSGGSCTVQICPEDVGGGWALQSLIDGHANRDRPVTICLEPGDYVLATPLRIGPEHGRLTIRAARPGVVLRAEPHTSARFVLGLIIARDADGLRLDGLEIQPAHASLEFDRDTYQNQPERARLVLSAHRHRTISIGLRAVRCRNLAVRDCRFVLSAPPAPAAPEAERSGHRPEEDLFGAGIFGAEELCGLRVERCTFTVREPIAHARRRPNGGEIADGPQHVTLGFVQVPTAMAVPPGTHGDEAEPTGPHGSVSVPLLDDAAFHDNRFEHLTAPVVAIGQLGVLRADRNTVYRCHAGFWLVIQHASHVLTFLDRLVNQVDDAYRDLVKAHLTALAEPLIFHTTVLARTLPQDLPEDPDAPVSPRRLEAPSTAEVQQASELHHQLSTPSAQEEPPPGAAQRATRLRGFVETFGRIGGTRRRTAEVVVPPEAALRCCLDITGNTFESGSAPALVVLDTAPGSAASLILTGNQLRSSLRPGAVACLYLLRSCAVTANVIVNGESDRDDAASLLVLPQYHHRGQQSAITGNVLTGEAHLPHRDDDLPSWRSLNSVTR